MAYHNSPNLASAGFPYDFREIDGKDSLVENAGTPIAGITDDIDGRLRDVTNPNIGHTEGFTGLSEPGQLSISSIPIKTGVEVARIRA